MTASEQIIQVIDALCAKLGIAVDWTSENVVPYIETLCGKLVNYEICTSIFSMVLCMVISIVSIVATKKLYPVFKNGVEEQGCYDVGWSVGSVLAIIGLVILNFASVCVIEQQITDIIKCATFPEMYIFEYVQKFINGC